MKSGGSLKHSQESVSFSNPEQDQFSPWLPISHLETHFNIIFPSTPRCT